MSDEYGRDPWREARRAPAWLTFATTWIALLSGAAHLYLGAARVVWVAGSAVLVVSCVVAVVLLRARARDRQRRLAAQTLLLWAAGLLTVLIAAALP
ncbi:hypothetical protein ABT369_33160 [Dactylosporangium sp. NPDC000244]|uniref:hypothetical protein n=1 Tax=Dactylosporangium sp. NPDC000244 TaxID=3154365 RepID=UPI003322DB17